MTIVTVVSDGNLETNSFAERLNPQLFVRTKEQRKSICQKQCTEQVESVTTDTNRKINQTYIWCRSFASREKRLTFSRCVYYSLAMIMSLKAHSHLMFKIKEVSWILMVIVWYLPFFYLFRVEIPGCENLRPLRVELLRTIKPPGTGASRSSRKSLTSAAGATRRGPSRSSTISMPSYITYPSKTIH